MARTLANFSLSTLNGAINNSTTTITLTNAATFPASGTFTIRIDDELINITSRSGNVLTAATRGGIEGTSAASHSDLAPVYGPLTLVALQEYIIQQATGAAVGGQATGTVGAITIADTHGTSGTTTHHAQAHNLFSASHAGDLDNTDTPADLDLLTYNLAGSEWNARPASAHGVHGGGGTGIRGAEWAIVYDAGASYQATKFDGTSISTNAQMATVLNAALVACEADGGGIVFVTNCPAASLNATVNLKGGVTLMTDGIGMQPAEGNPLVFGGTYFTAGVSAMVMFNAAAGEYAAGIDGICIDGNAATDAIGIRAQVGGGRYTNIRARSCRPCFQINEVDATWMKDGHLFDFYFTSSAGGIDYVTGAGDNATDWMFMHGKMGVCNTNDVDAMTVRQGGTFVYDLHISGSGGAGNGRCLVVNSGNTIVRGCYFDVSDSPGVTLNPTPTVGVPIVESCQFIGGDRAIDIEVITTGPVSIVNNTSKSFGTGPRWFVHFTQPAPRGLVDGNVVRIFNTSAGNDANGNPLWGMVGSSSNTLIPNGYSRMDSTAYSMPAFVVGEKNLYGPG